MRSFLLLLLFTGLGAADNVAVGAEDFKLRKDCKQTPWDCGECNKHTGTKKCTRKILEEPSWHGKHCGPNWIKKPCDVDCKVTELKYSPCSTTCGPGYQVGQRLVIVHPKNGGKKCPPLTHHKKCLKKPCPVNCKQGPYRCGKCNFYTGYKTCTRKTLVKPANNGKPCRRSSLKRKCIVDCRISQFGQWSNCSQKCGGGYQTTCRKIIYHPKHGGRSCPTLCEKRPCNIKPCSRDCVQTPFECGDCIYKTGYKKCSRKTLVYPLGDGKKCGPNWKETPCKVDCKVSDYGFFGRCSKKCGGGFQKRCRRIIYHPKNNGKYCPKLCERRSCNTKPCSRDCVQSPFTCGACDYKTGYKKCSREILVDPKGDGKKCGSNWKKVECKVDCKVSAYGYFGKCSKKCGGGYKKRCREVIYHPKNNGKYCPKLCETEPCNTKPCSRDCVQTSFKCEACNYKTGYKKCSRKTLVHPEGYGKKCGPKWKTVPCKINCKVSDFGYWNKCSKKCGNGYQKRCRQVIYHPKNGGEECPHLCETQKCGKPCSRDCVQGSFECGACNYHTGHKKCHRRTIVHPLYNGKQCGPRWKTAPCKVDCKVSHFGYWDKCSKKCGYGSQQRCRNIVYHPKNNGKYCPKLCETRKCGKPCSQDCVQSPFKCGKCNDYTGKRTCHRYIITHPLHHGKTCGPKSKTKQCAVNCKVSQFEDWNKCTKKCGGGWKKRCRKIIHHARNGGQECPNLCEKEKCNSHPCGNKYLGGHGSKIVGVCGLVLLAGAMKFLRRNKSDSYQELAESESVEREQLI